MPPKRGWSTWSTGQRVLIVIALVVGGAFTLLIASTIAAIAWFSSNGAQVPAEAVVLRESHAYFAFHPARDDPGVGALLRRVEEKVRDLERGADPSGSGELLRKLQTFSRQTAGFDLAIPREVWVSSSPESVVEGGFVAAVNLRAYGRGLEAFSALYARIAEGEAGRAREEVPSPVVHHGPYVVHRAGDVTLAFHGSTLLLARTVEGLTHVLDHIDAAPEAAVLPERFGALRSDLSEGTDAHWVVEAPAESYASAFSDWPEASRAAVAGVAIVAASMDLVTDDELRGVFRVTCRDGADVEALRAMIDAGAEAAVVRAEESALALQVSTAVDGAKITVTYRLTGLAAKVDALFEELAASAPPSPH